jgi:Skp family chaperone for outer membrane proteins
MTFTHFVLLARIPAAFSDQVAFPALRRGGAWSSSSAQGDEGRPAHNLTTNYHEWSWTTALTARSAYVKTLVFRPVIFTRNKAVLALAVAAALSTFELLNAQQPAPPAGAAVAGVNPAGANASKYNIAVVDISYIFKKHERFKATMEQMKKEMETIEGGLKGDREKIAAQEQQRNQFNAGSAEFKKMDEDIARQMAEFNLKMGKLRKEFLEREAKVYFQTYLEVVDAVKYYAKRQGIGLVLRFNGEPVDPNRRDDVLREINKPVVVQDQIDITPDVLALINREQSGGGAASQTGTQATRPVAPTSQIPR